MSSRRWTDTDLIAAVKDNITMAAMLRQLGLAAKGGSYKSVKRHIERLRLDTSHWLGMAWAVGKSLPSRSRPLEDILVEHSFYGTASLKRRLLKAGLKHAKCERCGITDWHGEPAPLELDHINSDHCDNRLINLQVLCAMCHALKTSKQAKNRKLPGKTCPRCSIQISRRSSFCRQCRFKVHRRKNKILWPEDAVVLAAKTNRGVTALARQLGISDGAIHKRVRKITQGSSNQVERECEELGAKGSNPFLATSPM